MPLAVAFPRVLRNGAIVLGTLLLAGLAGANAVENVARFTRPELAAALPFKDPVSLSRAADKILTKSPDSISSPLVYALARRSMLAQSLNPQGLRLLGFVADARGEQARAKLLISLSEQASRRHLPTQLWLIEESVKSGDIGQALGHYDVAMRANPDSLYILQPILAAALDEQSVRQAFAKIVRQYPPWLSAFVNITISGNSPAGNLSKALSMAGGLPRTDELSGLEKALMGKLVREGSFAEARRYYETLKGADRRSELRRWNDKSDVCAAHLGAVGCCLRWRSIPNSQSARPKIFTNLCQFRRARAGVATAFLPGAWAIQP
jgi:hypothetical protein